MLRSCRMQPSLSAHSAAVCSSPLSTARFDSIPRDVPGSDRDGKSPVRVRPIAPSSLRHESGMLSRWRKRSRGSAAGRIQAVPDTASAAAAASTSMRKTKAGSPAQAADDAAVAASAAQRVEAEPAARHTCPRSVRRELRGDINDLVWPLPAGEAVSTASADTEPAGLAAGGPDGGVAPVAARSVSPGPPGGGRVSGEDARTPNSRPGMAEPGFLVFGSPQPVRWGSPEPLSMPTGHTGGAYSRIGYETVLNKWHHRGVRSAAEAHRGRTKQNAPWIK